MKSSSIKDLILQKIFRIKNMEKKFINFSKLKENKELLSLNDYNEKIADSYIDISNYCIFLLIRKYENNFFKTQNFSPN